MAVARVVAFEDVDPDRMEQMDREMRDGTRPEGVPASEIVVLHDRDARRSLVIIFFDSDEDYAKGDAALNAMPADDTPGRRASVSRYDVAARMTA